MDLFTLDDNENQLRAQLVNERNRRYQAEEKLRGTNTCGKSYLL